MECLNDAQRRVIVDAINWEEYAKYIRGSVSYDEYIRVKRNREADFYVENSRNCTAIELAQAADGDAEVNVVPEPATLRIERLLRDILEKLEAIEEALNPAETE